MSPYPIEAAPVIIIGAGRSGTNMLRDVLTRLDGVATWPCDEINYIWRHGNRDFPTDELTQAQASDSVNAYIRQQFARIVDTSELVNFPRENRVILEKTCANSLRVPFVDAIVPEARYIHLVRDGRDVVASALQRWKAPLDIPYLLAKARYVPKSDLPYYANRYFGNRLSKLTSSDSALSVWGPKFQGMSELSKEGGLSQVCAAQWVRCVESATSAFNDMDPSRVIHLRYEDFVTEPATHLKSVTQFLALSYSDDQITQACSIVSAGSVGKGKLAKSVDLRSAEVLMKNTLSAHGYW